MMFRTAARTMLAATALVALSLSARAADISGAGATFPYPVYAKWAQDYKALTGTGINYQSIGSGGGIKQIKAKTVTFGATDASRLTRRRTDRKNGLVQFPMVMGGIVPIDQCSKASRLASWSSRLTARPSPASSWARSPRGTIAAIKRS